MNSNGMDVVLQPTSASFRVIGGVLDLYVLAGPTPLAVLEQLTAIIGRPMMVPAWSLGLMNSKWGPAPALAAPQGPDAGQRRRWPPVPDAAACGGQVRLHVGCTVGHGPQRLRQREHPPVRARRLPLAGRCEAAARLADDGCRGRLTGRVPWPGRPLFRTHSTWTMTRSSR